VRWEFNDAPSIAERYWIPTAPPMPPLRGGRVAAASCLRDLLCCGLPSSSFIGGARGFGYSSGQRPVTPSMRARRWRPP